MSGNVAFSTTSGYDLRTDRMVTRFDVLYAESPGPVVGTAPAGDVSAGRLVLRTDEESGNAQLLFTNGVKLLYQPRVLEE